MNRLPVVCVRGLELAGVGRSHPCPPRPTRASLSASVLRSRLHANHNMMHSAEKLVNRNAVHQCMPYNYGEGGGERGIFVTCWMPRQDWWTTIMSAGLDWDLRTCVEHCTALTDTVESPHSPARHPRTAHRLGDSVRHPTPSSIFTPTASRADIEDDRTGTRSKLCSAVRIVAPGEAGVPFRFRG